MNGQTLLFVLVTLAIGMIRAEANAPISEAFDKMSKIFGERQTRQGCATVQAIKNGSFSGVSQQCIDAIRRNPSNPYNGAICTSACNDLYQTYVQCYGVAGTQAAYKLLCTNGYQGEIKTVPYQLGEAPRQATAHYVVVAAALVAATTAVRAMMY